MRRQYSLEELRNLPLGSTIEHPRHGFGWVLMEGGKKKALFSDGSKFVFDVMATPWDMPLKIKPPEKG